MLRFLVWIRSYEHDFEVAQDEDETAGANTETRQDAALDHNDNQTDAVTKSNEKSGQQSTKKCSKRESKKEKKQHES